MAQNTEMTLTKEPAIWCDKQYRRDIESVNAAAKLRDRSDK